MDEVGKIVNDEKSLRQSLQSRDAVAASRAQDALVADLRGVKEPLKVYDAVDDADHKSGMRPLIIYNPSSHSLELRRDVKQELQSVSPEQTLQVELDRIRQDWAKTGKGDLDKAVTADAKGFRRICPIGMLISLSRDYLIRICSVFQVLRWPSQPLSNTCAMPLLQLD